ncbi:MAG: hypothetical protein Q4P66_04530 [Actinomycetaceae bacterium]|nr:hypothetical protein [Actinomycetaceae bacterium]
MQPFIVMNKPLKNRGGFYLALAAILPGICIQEYDVESENLAITIVLWMLMILSVVMSAIVVIFFARLRTGSQPLLSADSYGISKRTVMGKQEVYAWYQIEKIEASGLPGFRMLKLMIHSNDGHAITLDEQNLSNKDTPTELLISL